MYCKRRVTVGRSHTPDTFHQSNYLLIIISYYVYTFVTFYTDEHLISNLRLLVNEIVHITFDFL